jgi:hypothetical protein
MELFISENPPGPLSYLGIVFLPRHGYLALVAWISGAKTFKQTRAANLKKAEFLFKTKKITRLTVQPV